MIEGSRKKKKKDKKDEENVEYFMVNHGDQFVPVGQVSSIPFVVLYFMVVYLFYPT